MKVRCRRACFWCLVVVVTLTGPTQADNPRLQLPPSKLPPPKLPPLPAPRKLPPRSTTSRSAKDSSDRLQFKFATGQTFAYRIDIRADYADKAERYAGAPVFTVHSVRTDGTAELAAVGRLTLSTRPRGRDDFTAQSGDDVWLGSFLRVPAQGPSGGRDDLNAQRLPGDLHVFTKPSHLVFVGLPTRVGGQTGREGTASLFESKAGSVLGPVFSSTKGRETNLTRSELESGSVYRIIKEKGFRTTEGTPREWRYQSTSRFDKSRGLVLSTDGTLTFEDKGQKAVAIKISAHLLEGEELARAKTQAEADRAWMPAELEPFELKRVRLDLKDATRFKTTKDLKPGMTVAHFQSAGGHQWYLAEVAEVLTDYKLKVRYRGSREEFGVHAGELALLPADKKSR